MALFKIKQTAPLFEELEPRLLFSADVAEAFAIDAAQEQSYEEPAIIVEESTESSDAIIAPDESTKNAEPANNPSTTQSPLEEVEADEEIDTLPPENTISGSDEDETDSEKDSVIILNQESEIIAETEVVSDEESTGRVELVLINENVYDIENLISDIEQTDTSSERDLEIIVLDDEQDGITQVSEILAEREDLKAIHIITHGSGGYLALGDDWYDTDDLTVNSETISSWGDALSEDADILLYGCSIADGDDGQSFVDTLAQLTDADVAASDDHTGHVSLNGDWELEYVSGEIETSILPTLDVRQNWNHLLSATIGDNFDTIAFSGSNGTVPWNNDWQEINESDGADQGAISIYNHLSWGQGLLIGSDHVGVFREVDLSAATTATLNFDMATSGLDAGDSVILTISTDGGGTWDLIDAYGSNSSLHGVSYDISAYIDSDTQIKFESTTFGDNDEFFVDNIQITFSTQLAATSELLVNTFDSGNPQETSAENRGSNQAVAMDDNGNYVVVWSSLNQDGSGWGVFAQRYDAVGVAQGLEFKVAETTNENQLWARVAMDATGNFTATWTSENQDGTSSSVYARQFDADGTPDVAGEFRVNTENSGAQSNSSIAMDDSGNFTIVWQGNGGSDTNGIYFRRFNADGTAIDASDQLANQTSGTAEHDPVIAMQTAGKFVIAWDEGAHIYFQRFDAAGVALGSETQIDGFLSTSSGLAVDSDFAGSFTFVYHEEFIGTGIWQRSFNEDGTEKYAWQQVISGDAKSPSISMDDAGNFLVVYEKTGDGDGLGVYGRRYYSTGFPIDSEFLINETTSGTQHMASVAVLDMSHFVAVWSGQGAADTAGVYARQFANTPPIADATAGAPYVINEGDNSLILDGSNSSDPDGDILTYLWDINNDGIYGDRIGEMIPVDWFTLQTFGINDNGLYTIGLRVQDTYGNITDTSATLTVDNVAPILFVSGDGTVDAGAEYTLNFSAIDPGYDTITSWTINWGDGNIEILAGNPLTATHTYTNAGFTNNILVSATDEDNIVNYIHNDLFVGHYVDNAGVYRIQGTWGDLPDEFGDDGILDKAIQPVIGPDGNLYVSGESSRNVLRYDPATGNSMGVFATISGEAGGIVFGPDGNLYVADYSNNEIVRFDGSDGSALGAFVSGIGGSPYGITFGPDGNLYVSTYDTAEVFKYDGATGDSLGIFVSAGSGGLGTPEQMVFGPDGNLYIADVANGKDNVLRFNGATGAFIDTFVSSGDGGLTRPNGIAFGPDGNLYVTDSTDGLVLRFDGNTGAFIDEYVSSLDKPSMIAFAPDHQVLIQLTNNNAPTASGTYNWASIDESTTSIAVQVSTILADPSITSNDIDGDTLGIAVFAKAGNGTWEYSIDGVSGWTDFGVVNPNVAVLLADDSWVRYVPDGINSETSHFDFRAWDQTTDLASSTGTPRFGDTTSGGGITAYSNGSASVSLIVTNNSNAAPTFTSFVGAVTSGDEDSEITVTFANLAVQGDEVDLDGTVDAFVVKLVSSGTLRIGTNTGTATAWIAGSNDTLNASIHAYWTPAADANGLLTAFEVVAQDNDGAESPTNVAVHITVNPVNDAPVLAVIGNQSVDELSALNFTVNASDIDLPEDTLTFSLDAASLAAGMTINSSSGVFNWTPGEAQDGVHSVTITVTDDGSGPGPLSDSETFTITVADINVGPVLNPIANQNVNELTTLSFIATATDSDLPAGTLTYSLDAASLAAGMTINTNSGAFSWTPSEAQDGVHSVTITVIDDGSGPGPLSDSETFTIIVADINVAPVLNLIANQNVDELTTLSFIATATDSDVPVGTLTYSLDAVSLAAGMTINTSSGAFSWTPSEAQDGVHSITITVTDNGSGPGPLSDSETFTITVNENNEAPIANNDIASGNEDTLITGNVLSNDTDVDANVLSVYLTTFPTNGNVILTSDGNFSYTPNVNWYGTDSFTYRANDGTENSNEATVTITVLQVNDTPNALDDNSSTTENNPVTTGNVLSNDNLGDEASSITGFDAISSQGGTISYNNDGTFTYTPAIDFIGTDSFTYTISDSDSETSTATVTVAVTMPVVVPPVGEIVLVDPEPETPDKGGNDQDIVEVKTDIPGEEQIIPDVELIIIDGEDYVESETEEEETEETSESPIENPDQSDDDSVADTQDTPVDIIAAPIEQEIILASSTKQTANMPDEPGRTAEIQKKTLFTHQSIMVQKENVNSSTITLLLEQYLDRMQFESEAAYTEAFVQLRNVLEDFQEEAENEIHYYKTVVGSAIAVSSGLSVGYVVWMIRGGMLLSSVLCSMPAWQIADPLPLLSHGKGDEKEDSETLETIIKDGSSKEGDRAEGEKLKYEIH